MPALVLTAEDDPPRDESLTYARRLREAGVTVQEHVLAVPTGWPDALGLATTAPVWASPVRDHFIAFFAACSFLGSSPSSLEDQEFTVIDLSSRRRLFSVGSALTQASKAVLPPKVEAVVVEQRDVTFWPEFSGRLEAVERVGIGSYIAGAVQAVHFGEGALVREGDSLITFDPASYAAEVDRAEAEMLAAPPPSTLAIGELLRTKSDSELLRIDD